MMKTAELDKKLAALLLALFSVLYISTIRRGEDGWNGASRLALVQAIVEQGKLSTDDSLYTELGNDKAYVHGHYYSEKAPGQSLTAVPFYWVLYHLGISFGRNRSIAEVLLKIPFALLSALVPMLFFMVSKYYSDDLKSRLLVSLALGAGTGVFVSAGMFIAHSSAAALLLLSFYSTLRARENSNWLWLSGSAGGIAACFDYPALLPAMAIHLNYLIHERRIDIGKAVCSALPFVALILLFNLRITGNVLDFPAYHIGDWPGSIWTNGFDRFELGRVTLQHAALMFFFGPYPYEPNEIYWYQGLFLYSPFLLLGLWYSKKEHLILLAGCVAVALMYLGTADPVGGRVFSNRYLVITLPFLALPALGFAERWPKVFSIAAGASIIMNFIGASTLHIPKTRFPLMEAIARLPTLLHYPIVHAVSLSLIVLTLLVLFSSNTRKGGALIRDLLERKPLQARPNTLLARK